MRGNLYLYNGTVSGLVLKLFDSLTFKVKRGTFRFPRKLLGRKLRSFSTMLRIAHGYCTYDQKRKFLSDATRNNEQFVVPSEKDMPLVLKGVLSKGMVHLAFSANNRIIGLYQRLKDF